MLLSPEQEALCERVEKGVPEPGTAALIRQQAQEIDALWDRLSHAYALVRRESPAEMIQEEMRRSGLCSRSDKAANQEICTGRTPHMDERGSSPR